MKTVYSNCVKLLFAALFMSVLLNAQAAEKNTVIPGVKRLTASSTENSITVRWQLINTKNLQRIQLYRKAYSLPVIVDKPDFDKPAKIDRGLLIAELDSNQLDYQDELVQPGYYYYYRLVLQHDNRMESEPSAPALAALKDKLPPEKAVLLTAKGIGDSTFSLSWQASKSKDVVAYRVYRSTEKGSAKILRIINLEKAGEKKLSRVFKQTGSPRYIYQYSIAAVDGAGNVSALSNAIALRLPDTEAPSTPALLTATQQSRQIKLEWIANRENDLAGYRAYRRNNQTGAVFKPLHKKLLSDIHFIDNGVKPLSAYRYRVAAVDLYGNESRETRGILFRTTRFGEALSAVQRIKLKTNKKGFPLLSWKKTADKNKDRQYIVMRSEGVKFLPVSGLLKTALFTDYSVVAGRAYKYRVQVLSKSGDRSPLSESATVMWNGGGQ